MSFDKLERSLPTAGSNPESPIQILIDLYLWIGNSRYEPALGSSATQLKLISIGPCLFFKLLKNGLKKSARAQT